VVPAFAGDDSPLAGDLRIGLDEDRLKDEADAADGVGECQDLGVVFRLDDPAWLVGSG